MNKQCVSCESDIGRAVCPNATGSDLWTNDLVMREPRGEHACLKRIAVRKLMILILVTILVSGCYGKVDYSTGWSQWFVDPQAALANEEAKQLIF